MSRRQEFERIVIEVREECHAGVFDKCWRKIQELHDHVWEQLKKEAMNLQVADVQKPKVQSVDGNGYHVRLPACGNGTGAQESPELFYLHVHKNAGHNIVRNLQIFVGDKKRELPWNFPSSEYMYFNESKAKRPNTTFSFTFARNPLTRFISSYTELEFLKQGRFPNNTSPKGTTARALDFIRGILREGFYNIHIKPQAYFHLNHYEKGGNPFDFIGRLEDFKNDWQQLENISNCTGKLGRWDYDLGKHPSQFDPDHAAAAMGDVIEDPHPSHWRSLGIDPQTGFDDGKFHKANIAMRELLLSSNGVALRVICLLLLPDFYILSYPLPAGCKHLSI